MTYETPLGIPFYRAVKEVQELLDSPGETEFELAFNYTLVEVSVESNPRDLTTIYYSKRQAQN